MNAARAAAVGWSKAMVAGSRMLKRLDSAVRSSAAPSESRPACRCAHFVVCTLSWTSSAKAYRTQLGVSCLVKLCSVCQALPTAHKVKADQYSRLHEEPEEHAMHTRDGHCLPPSAAGLVPLAAQ